MFNALSGMLKGHAVDKGPNRRIIIAHDLIERLSEKLGLSLTALGSLTGAQLAGCQYRHPLFDRTSPVVIGGDYITTESGTGLVHTAPGHGQEDYQARTSDCHFNSCIRMPCIMTNRTSLSWQMAQSIQLQVMRLLDHCCCTTKRSWQMSVWCMYCMHDSAPTMLLYGD